MTIFWAIFYGIIQGVTEFLPISSSGHLAIAQNLFRISIQETSSLTFDILLHLGTLIAVFIVYYKDIFQIIHSIFSVLKKLLCGKFRMSCYTDAERFVIFIFISTLPLALAVLFKDKIESLGSSTKIIGCILLLNGAMLYLSDKLKKESIDQTNQKKRHAIFVGISQLIATIPGLSRSGTTITSGLLMGFKREYAVKYSFILSIPAVVGANIFSFAEMFEEPIPQNCLLPYFIGTVTAALVGIASMKLIIYISKKSNFRFFSYYCFAIGLIAIIFGQ